MRNLSFTLFCVCVFLLHSCKNYEDFREVDHVNYNPELAVPLINSSLSIEDILESQDSISFLTVNSDGSMSLNYSQEEVDKKASDLIEKIADFPIVLIDSFMSVPVQIFENFTISKLNLKRGSISFEIGSSHTENIDLNISFPGMIKNGIPFQVETEIAYQGSTPTEVTIPAEYFEGFELSVPGGNLEVRYTAYNSSGQRVLLDKITGEARDWEYSSIEGVWDTENFTISTDTIEIDIFEEWTQGQIRFEDPKLILDIRNSIGFPTQIKLENLTAHTKDGNTISLTSVFDEGYDLKFPSLNEMGMEKSDQIVLDKNNSNIVSILNAQPTHITYNVLGTINPENNPETGFVSENSAIKGDLSVEVPVYGTASEFTLETTSDFEMEEVEELTHAEFKLIVKNGIPLELDIQVYFLDENNTIIDSLFNNQGQVIPAPEVGANGAVVNILEDINFIDVPAERLDNIQTAKQIKVKASLTSANQGLTPVKIFTNQEIEIKLGAIFGIEN